MPRIVFFCHDTMANIETMEYYRQDIEALRALGHEVVVCNRYRDIPLRFDLMFVWWWTFALVPVLFARMTGRKAVIAGVYNFRFEQPGSGVDFFARPLHQRVLIALATQFADANLFTSHREFAEVTEHFALSPSFHSPCAVGDAYFDASKTGKARELLLNLAWSSPENLQRKGVWTILEAAKILVARKVSFKLVLAGKEGEALPQLHERFAELVESGHVEILGEVTQNAKLALFARTRFYLQPSFFEGFGLATAEAAAAGACVITTDVGEVRTVMGDGAAYVPPGDAEALADMIERLLADPVEIAALSAKASERIANLYSAAGKREAFSAILARLGVVDGVEAVTPAIGQPSH